ncbi:hypothetical protein D3C72_558290 [compost metagenome]
MGHVVADRKERFTFFQGDAAFVLVIAEGQISVQVQFELATVTQRDLADSIGSGEMLIAVGQPAQIPAGVRRQRQGERTDAGRYSELTPRARSLTGWHNRNGFRARQMFGHLPDFQHGLVLECMQGMSVVPLLECTTFGVRAVIGVHPHAPMRGGIGDRIVFGFRESVLGH